MVDPPEELVVDVEVEPEPVAWLVVVGRAGVDVVVEDDAMGDVPPEHAARSIAAEPTQPMTDHLLHRRGATCGG